MAQTKEEFLADLFSQEIKPATRKEPKTLLLYSHPKVGKSSICAGLSQQLNGKCKILSLEKGGYDGLDANDKFIGSTREFMTALKAFRDNPHDFTHLIIDGMTNVQKIAFEEGTKIYQRTSQGKKWNVVDGVRLKPEDSRWEDASTLPNGYGYRWNRLFLVERFMNDIILQMPDHLTVILIAHVKQSVVEEGITNKISKTHIDLSGKNSTIISGMCDAICMLKRKGNKGILNFNPIKSEGSMGSRYSYLKDEIVISEMGEDGKLMTYWERIFPSIKNNKQ